MTSLLTPFYSLLLSFFVLLVIYASIGDRMFGGLVSRNAGELYRAARIPDTYVYLNMNDMVTAFITLVCVMVSNW